MKHLKLFFLFLPFLLTSCEDVIDVNLEQGRIALVVDGWVTTDEKPFSVKLSKTSNYFDSTTAPPFSGAMVTISDNEGNTDVLQEVNPGIYVTNGNRKGKIGNTYILNIVAEGEKYTAITEIRRVPPIDSLTLKYKNNKENPEESGFSVLYYGPEYEGPGDYYKFKISKNDTLLNDPEDVWNISSDEMVEGNYIGELEMYSGLKEGEKVQVETLSITKDAYLFYTELALQVNNGGMFANPPANIRTNVINENPASKNKAVGYFGGSAISKMEVTAPYFQENN